jgi:hypothetical protein
MQCKPKATEKLIIVEDFYGDKSLMWVACIDIESNKELWRHNISDVIRLTYE